LIFRRREVLGGRGKGNAGAPMISNRPSAAIGKNGGYRWLRFRVIAKKYLKFYE
jgi:hypothetical protein